MPETAIVVLVAALGSLAFAIGRWWTLLLPFVAVPGLYLGLEREWWGYGLGDGWQYAMFGVLTLTVGVMAAAVGVRRLATPRRGLHRGRG